MSNPTTDPEDDLAGTTPLAGAVLGPDPNRAFLESIRDDVSQDTNHRIAASKALAQLSDERRDTGELAPDELDRLLGEALAALPPERRKLIMRASA